MGYYTASLSFALSSAFFSVAEQQSFKTNDLKCAKKVRAKIILLLTDWNSREKADNMAGS